MARLKTEKRQNMIIDEAMKIIHSGGYGALSIRALAQNVKISEPAIYRHFLNKEDIVLGILNRIMVFEQLVETELLTKKTAKEKIKHFILFRLKYLEKNPEMTSVLFAEDIFTQSEILRNRMFSMLQKRKRMLADIIEDAKSEGEIADVKTENILIIIFGSIRMIVLEWRLNNFKFSLAGRGKSMLNTLDKLIFTS
jgi:TetR/AcrR family fatty acid metabolism transcriptional regulator